MEKTGLDQIVSIHFGSREGPWRNPSSLADDPRWQLAQRIVDSAQFSKSPRLSSFLLYIVSRSIEGRENEVTEQQIGVHVFGRPPGYRTVDDNIVRNYARQLRKRLAEYFASEGTDDAMRIEIPLGGYLPAFTTSGLPAKNERKPIVVERPLVERALVGRTVTSTGSVTSLPVSVPRRKWRRQFARTCLSATYSALLIWLTWLGVRSAAPRRPLEPAAVLWKAMLQGPGNTYIVPPDDGLKLLSRQSMPLADYIGGKYLDRSQSGVDAHSETDWRAQQLTGFTDLQMVATLARLSEYDPARVFLRFPRDLRLDDLKSANAVFIGSACNNPWAVIAESSTNFRIHCNAGKEGAIVVKLKPQSGEAASYTSHWNEPIHETYAVITFIPNLSGYGHLLLLGGLDAAATQAAGEALLSSDTITPILQRARRPDGSLAAFEVLLRTTSIQANATDTHVMASRVY